MVDKWRGPSEDSIISPTLEKNNNNNNNTIEGASINRRIIYLLKSQSRNVIILVQIFFFLKKKISIIIRFLFMVTMTICLTFVANALEGTATFYSNTYVREYFLCNYLVN